MKKLGSLLFLIVVAAGVWLGVRYFAHRGEVRATVIFHSAEGLRKGDPVVDGETVIGRVTGIAHLDGEDAVSIRLDRGHARSVVGDSLFAISDGRLVVNNTFAVGAPIDDGAVLRAKQDTVSRWLARHGGAVQPFIRKLKEKADEALDGIDADHIDKALDEWKKEVPEWKREGGDALDRHLKSIREHVEKLEHDLEASNRGDEARQLKEKFERWIDEVRK